MGSVLDAAQATVWGWRQLKTALCGGGSSPLARGWGPLAGQLMRVATGPHRRDREPEPGRGARKGLRLGCQWLSQSTVCAEGLEKSLATQQVDPGATAPSPQALDPEHLLSPSAFQDKHVWVSLSSTSLLITATR